MSRDIVAVSLKTHQVRIIERGKAPNNAAAIVKMAVARRGVTEEFFTTVPSGLYNEGDTWFGTDGAA